MAKFSPENMQRKSRIVMLARLFIILLIVFIAEIVSDLLLTGTMPFNSIYVDRFADAIFLILFTAPFLWWVLLRPFRDLVLIEKAQFEYLYLQMVDSVVILDEMNRITACNPAAEKLFGFSSSEVEGEEISRVIECPSGSSLFDKPCYSEPVTQVLHCYGIAKEGEKIPLSVSSSEASFNRRNVKVLIIRDITTRVKSEKKLRESEYRFRNLADFAPVGIFEADARGDCIFVNRKWCEIAGLSFEQALGQGWVVALHPDDLDNIRREWRQATLENRSFMIHEYRFQSPDKKETWVLGHISTLTGEDGAITGYMGIVIDINERKKAEQALRESEDRFRVVFEKSEDAILLFTPGRYTIIDVNETTEMLYGYSRSELIGNCLSLFRTDAEYHDFLQALSMITDTGSCQLEHIKNITKGGSEIHLSVRAKIIKLQGHDAIYCTMRDISSRLLMEEETRSIQSQLIHSNKMTSLGLLVAGIAHEINNPNNYIMANSQMLYRIWEDLDPMLREKATGGDFVLGGLPYSTLEKSLPEMITAINEGSRRIKNIIGGLKNYSRKGGPVIEPMDVNRAVYSSMMLLNHHIRKYTDNFELDLEDNLPALKGSSQQIEQVIINLVMNALQSLTSREQRLALRTSLSRETNSILLTVEDEGRGIPEGAMSRIMEPFFTTRLDSGGTGLGLSITRSIILAHNGQIEFSSRSGQGTSVTVSLPV